MTDQWRQEPEKDKDGWNGRNSVQAAIAFAFFSILVWVDIQMLIDSFKFIHFLSGWIDIFCISSVSRRCFEFI